MKNERKEELKDEMKNRISLVLKDPILQQGFEIICKENAELKNQLNKNPCVCNTEWHCNDCLEQLTKAKEIIKNIIRVTWGEGWNYSLDWKVKAEQFISEVEK